MERPQEEALLLVIVAVVLNGMTFGIVVVNLQEVHKRDQVQVDQEKDMCLKPLPRHHHLAHHTQVVVRILPLEV
jgi:hypothetical protein